MAEKRWVMMRVEEHVHAALLHLRRKLAEARDNCHPSLQEMDPDLSLSGLVMRLIRHHLNDQRRKRESRLRVKARKRAQRAERRAGA